jgi:hypothetical protein
MNARLPFCLIPVLAAVITPLAAFGQQLAFTSRGDLQSPVVIDSVLSSKEFGFESVALRNEGRDTISAVYFRIVFRTDAGDEVADERRISVIIDPHDGKTARVDLGEVTGLRQLARSRKQASALVILTVESVEFRDGGEWKPKEPQSGIPQIDIPIQPKK